MCVQSFLIVGCYIDVQGKIGILIPLVGMGKLQIYIKGMGKRIFLIRSLHQRDLQIRRCDMSKGKKFLQTGQFFRTIKKNQIACYFEKNSLII